jgi:OmpA-OmpF porin, OOP family
MAPSEALASPVPRTERLTLSARELFGFDEATLQRPQPKLDDIADAMMRNPEIERVTITGYTDRIGSASYNEKLSQRRAAAVKAYLTEKGVEGRRLVAIGKGKANPVAQCSDTNTPDLIKCLEPNRRVEVEQITLERKRDAGSHDGTR